MVKVLQIGRSLVRSQIEPLEFFIDIKSFRSHYGPGVDSASNRNEYQEYLLGGKGGLCIRLTTYHHPVPLSWNLGTLTSRKPLGHSRPVTGLLYQYPNCSGSTSNQASTLAPFPILCSLLFIGHIITLYCTVCSIRQQSVKTFEEIGLPFHAFLTDARCQLHAAAGFDQLSTCLKHDRTHCWPRRWLHHKSNWQQPSDCSDWAILD